MFIMWDSAIRFVVFLLFLLFFFAFRTVVFLLLFIWFSSIWIDWFWWFFSLLHIRCLLVCCYIHTNLTRAPLFANIPLTWPYLTTSTIPANLLFFFRPDMHRKISTARPFTLFFRLFFVPFVPLHPTTPIRTHLYPSAPIRDNFCLSPQNMMFGEISPTIGPKIYPARSFLSLFTLFLRPPRAPCVPTHPYALIRTHFYLFAPVCTLNWNVYMYNLIEK